MIRLFEPLGISTGFSCPIYCNDATNNAHTYRKVAVHNPENPEEHRFEVVDRGFTVNDLGLRQRDMVTVRDNFSDRCLRVAIRILKYTTFALAIGIGVGYVASLIGYAIVPIITLAIGLGVAAGVCFIAMMIHRWIANSHEEAYFSAEQKAWGTIMSQEKLYKV